MSHDPLFRRTSLRAAIYLTFVSALLSFGVLAVQATGLLDRPNPTDVVRLFATPQQAADALPDPSQFGSFSRVDSTTSRLVYADAGARHWLATNARGEVCGLTLLDPNGPWTYGAGCEDVRRFQEYGLPLEVSGPTTKSVVRFVPDGLVDVGDNREIIAASGADVPTDNLIVFRDGYSNGALMVEGLKGYEVDVSFPPSGS